MFVMAQTRARVQIMWHYYYSTMSYINGIGRTEWFYILIGAMVVGGFCMRGYGSRKDY